MRPGFYYDFKEVPMKTFVAGLAMLLLTATGAQAANFSVAITNLTQGIYFTPLLVAAHPAGNHLFEVATTASTNLKALAEGGATTGLESDLSAMSADVVVNPLGGNMGPGVSTTASFPATAAANTQLSIVAMMLPTNDGFVGLDALTVPTAPGTYTYYLNAYDAGTEVNNELVNGGGAPGVLGIPADPGGAQGTGGTGVATTEANATVHIHRGNVGDTNATGGISDLDSRIHRWLNPVARVVITVN